jgi:O-antigen ligase
VLTNAKALVVVLALALLAFHVCKPTALQFMQESTFKRRRNVWFALTIGAFLSPGFWWWAVPAMGLLAWAGHRDRNPLGVYCFLAFTFPPVSLAIPVPFINHFFSLTPERMLAFTLLIPAILRFRNEPGRAPGFGSLDALVCAFVILQVVLLMPYETITNTMRRTLLLVTDLFLVTYSFSRIRDRFKLEDVMASLWLAVAIMAPIAIFESLRSWLLYEGVRSLWGGELDYAYIFRGGTLRAQAAAGHSLPLGFHMMVALGLQLYLCGGRKWTVREWGISLAMIGALVVSGSRGAWVSYVCLLLVFSLLRPNALRHLPRAAGMTALATLVLLATPLRDLVIARLPYIGTADQNTVAYREQLAQLSWSLVLENPLFGDPFVVSRMEALRSGNLIDLVNAYLYTALFTGFVGLAIHLCIYLLPPLKAWVARGRTQDVRWRLLFAVLLSCLAGTMLFIATALHERTGYLILGLLASAAAMVTAARASRAPAYTMNRPTVANA